MSSKHRLYVCLAECGFTMLSLAGRLGRGWRARWLATVGLWMTELVDRVPGRKNGE